MTQRRYLIAVAGMLALTACKEYLPFASNTPGGNWLSEQRVSAPSSEITVMTQNLYVGADVDLVIHALATPDPSDDFPALMFAIETVGKTDYPARAQAIADQIARARPHAVGLQEVSRINIDLRPLGLPAVVDQDFLEILQAALADRGLHYDVAAMSDNINVNLVSGLVQLQDHDVLLVDADRVSIDAASGQAFAVNVGEVVAGVVLVRGWVYARATIGGESYTFASAHTESNLAGVPVELMEQIRAAQVGEIVATIGQDERVVVMGDLNDLPGSPMYGVLTNSGYTDTWSAMRPGVAGLTCCHLADLSDHVANFDQRIDYIWTRGFDRDNGSIHGTVDRFGDVPADQLAGPAYSIWPADHVGLVAALR